MKKYFMLLVLLSIAACQKETVEKPANLIPKDKMKNIIYDLSLLQAMKGINQAILDTNGIDPGTYVYKKYKIDSLQFAKSDRYYATQNIKDYKKMYDEISESLTKERERVSNLLKKENDTTKILDRKDEIDRKNIIVK